MSNNNSGDDNSSEEIITFENQMEQLLKNATEYSAMSTTEKIQHVDKYNSIIACISEYEGILEEYKKKMEDTLNKIDKTDKKKKVTYNNKTFTSAMDKLIQIKDKLDDDISLDELLTLYEELTNIQVKMVPYLEGKKLEIVKI